MNARKVKNFSTRKSIDANEDPYLMSEQPNGTAVCVKCKAVFHNKRWYQCGELDEKIHQGNVTEIHCPACRKVRDNFPGGILNIRGEFMHDHRNEIMNLIRNEEKRAQKFNPLVRIIRINENHEEMEITTTNEKLAQRIGKSLQKAYQGRVEYKWSDDTKLLRAEWER